MKNFSYLKVGNIEDALKVLDENKEKIYLVAGGTNVMVDIRAKKRNNLTLVSICDIGELKGIKEENGKITIGSLTTIDELANSEILRDKAATLFLSANDFADPTTCNSATIGGNIANASPAADTATPLLALDAEVIIENKNGVRRVAIDEFFTGVNKTVLKPDELITRFEFKPSSKTCFYKLGLRNAMAISIVTVACNIEVDDKDIITECKIALGSVAPKPVRAYSVEKNLIGKKYTEKNVDEALEYLKDDISPIDDIRSTKEYRNGVSKVIVKRVLNKSFGICEQEGAK